MSIVKVVRAQVGQSATPGNNYVLRAMDDGVVRLSRGNAGAEIADVLVVNADNTLSVLASPPQFDNSLKLATTASLQAALGNMAGYGGLISANNALAAAGVGKFYTVSGATTVSLPTPAANLAGATVELIGVDAANNYTVNVTGGTNIVGYSGLNAAALTCFGGSPIVFRCTGAAWQVVSGAERYRADWASSFTSSGYQKLPSGLIIQWGGSLETANLTEITCTFPIAFPNGCLAASLMPSQSAGTAASAWRVSISKTILSYAVSSGGGGSTTLFWMAIGN